MSGFLDNSGDIIIDVVLTDEGRNRLARSDGSFKIVKFAVGDDEIDYSQYNYSHVSGSAYYDLSVLQTPVLEAFTNNASSMKSMLISIPRNNLLYLPIIKLNEVNAASKMHTQGAFYVCVDDTTETAFAAKNITQGILYGETLTNGGQYIQLDQGIDSTEISYAFPLDADLVETQYILEIDNRFGKIISYQKNTQAKMSYLDDDNIASYYFSFNTDPDYVVENKNNSTQTGETISGPRGTIFRFKIASSLDLNTSNYLFSLLGTTGVAGNNAQFGLASTYTVSYIDTYIKITGATTGYTVYVPVRFVKAA